MVRLIRHLAYLVAVVGCASTKSKPVHEAAPQVTHQVLSKLPVIRHPAPLPAEQPIQSTTYIGDRKVGSRLVYRGWDFDRDGSFEMLESINDKSGRPVYSIDFDGDGTIDVISRD